MSESAAQRHRRLEFHDPLNPECRFSADPGVASPDADWCSCPISEQPAGGGGSNFSRRILAEAKADELNAL